MKKKRFSVDQIRRLATEIQRNEARRIDYNQRRPYSSLGHLTPNKYVQQGQNSGAEKAAFL